MKRSLPLIILILVSFFVFLCAAGVVYFLSVDAHTVEEKVQSVLMLGLPSGLVLILLLWFGAGLDHLLARIQDRSRRVRMSVLTYLLVPIGLCVGLPALVAVLIYGSIGAPVGWRQLPAVPESPVEVAAANELSVIISTGSGAYYSCVTSSPTTCWEVALRPEQRMSGRGIEITTPPYTEPPGEVVSMLSISYMDLGEEGQVHYAVLEDGSVWVLRKDANKYEAGFATGLFLTIALIPAAAGLLVIYLGPGSVPLHGGWRIAVRATPIFSLALRQTGPFAGWCGTRGSHLSSTPPPRCCRSYSIRHPHTLRWKMRRSWKRLLYPRGGLIAPRWLHPSRHGWSTRGYPSCSGRSS